MPQKWKYLKLYESYKNHAELIGLKGDDKWTFLIVAQFYSRQTNKQTNKHLQGVYI